MVEMTDCQVNFLRSVRSLRLARADQSCLFAARGRGRCVCCVAEDGRPRPSHGQTWKACQSHVGGLPQTTNWPARSACSLGFNTVACSVRSDFDGIFEDAKRHGLCQGKCGETAPNLGLFSATAQ